MNKATLDDAERQARAPAPINRPALRYYGGKWRIAKWILREFPPHRCYVEPFGGAASVLLRKTPAALEVYNDLDGDVVTFFRVLRDRPADLVRAVTLTPYSREELELSFAPAADLDDLERARRLFVRMWQGRGGARNNWRPGWRFQRSDNQRTSFVDDWIGNERLSAISERLRLVQIEASPALDVIARFDTPETLFYCDPPYVHSTRSARWRFEGYSHEMAEADHAALLGALREIRGMAIVSGYETPLYEDLLGDWRKETRATITDGSNRRAKKPRAVEAIWISPAADARGRQLTLGGHTLARLRKPS